MLLFTAAVADASVLVRGGELCSLCLIWGEYFIFHTRLNCCSTLDFIPWIITLGNTGEILMAILKYDTFISYVSLCVYMCMFVHLYVCMCGFAHKCTYLSNSHRLRMNDYAHERVSKSERLSESCARMRILGCLIQKKNSYIKFVKLDGFICPFRENLLA